MTCKPTRRLFSLNAVLALTAVVAALHTSTADAEFVAYRISPSGIYQQAGVGPLDWDAYFNYGQGATYIRGDEIRFPNGNYMTISPAHGGLPSYSVSDIDNVLWSGPSETLVTFRGAESSEQAIVAYRISPSGIYQQAGVGPLDWDAYFNYGQGATYIRGDEIRFPNGNYMTISPAHGGLPSFSVSDIDDVLWSGPSETLVTFRMAVPEPASAVLLAMGLLGTFIASRRRRPT